MDAILLPQIGQDITTGKIVEWHRKEDDPVEKGEIVVTVESEKAVFEVEADTSGVLLKILHNDGEEAEVLAPIGYIGQPGETVDEAVGTGPTGKQTAGTPGATPPGHGAREERRKRGKLPASPVARRMAAKLGVKLDTVTGTGPGGRIRKEDVLAAADAAGAATPSPPGEDGDETIPFTGMRRVIAERLTRSKQTIPHIYLFVDVDMESALVWRRDFNAEHEAHITVTDQIAHAVARALKDFPRLNGHVENGAVIVKRAVNIGIATATDDGLLVPILTEADRHDIEGLSKEIKRVTAAARDRKLEANTVGSFTITSLGMFGIRGFIPIINPPECAILGVGAMEPRVVAHAGEVAVRQTMTLALACDHRAIDGVYAAGFLGRVKEELENVG